MTGALNLRGASLAAIYSERYTHSGPQREITSALASRNLCKHSKQFVSEMRLNIEIDRKYRVVLAE